MIRLRRVALIVAWTASAGVARAAEEGTEGAGIAREARGVIKQLCYRCHHGKGSPSGSDADFLNRADLVAEDRVKPGEPGASLLLERIVKGEMPPKGETPEPRLQDVATLWQWIEAAAPAFPKDAAKRPFVTAASALAAARDHLRAIDEPDDRHGVRFFTIQNLANNPEVSEAELRLARAALSKALNSLSRRREIVVPKAVDPAKVVFAVNIRDLDWDFDAWLEVERAYPYGLDHPNDPKLGPIERDLRDLSGCDLPILRADWFVATATRPPLYHELLRSPRHARDLERELGVDVAERFLAPRATEIAQAGFKKSGVSGQNRHLSWYDTRLGGLWESDDFKPNNGKANLSRLPLGPLNLFRAGKHPFPRQAFVHNGGEIIYPLANGLQAYLLVDGNDNRIDTGPIDVVNDPLKTSGTPEIVNGVSCMNCHKTGMLGFKDEIRASHSIAGEAEQFLLKLYPGPKAMDELVRRDSERFLTALEKAVGPFLREGADAKTPLREFPEPIGTVARAYRLDYLDLNAVAREFDLEDPHALVEDVGKTKLKRLGLDGLLKGGFIGRAEWEAIDGVSLMQRLGEDLRMSPVNAR